MAYEFTQFGTRRLDGTGGRRAAIDMSEVEAVLEHEKGGCVVVTSSDSYHVEEAYEGIIEAWGGAL